MNDIFEGTKIVSDDGTTGICLGIGKIGKKTYITVETDEGQKIGPVLVDGWQRRDMSFEPDKDIKAFIGSVIGVVEATSYESLSLWKFHHEEHGDSWESGRSGYGVTVGYVDHRPVCVTLNVNLVRNQPILFLEPTSQIVDHQMIEDWLLKALPRTAFRKNYNNIHGEHINKVDSMNFSNIFRD